MALLNFKAGRSADLEQLSEQLTEGLHAEISQVAEYMKNGIEQGELRADLDPETITRALLAYQDGVTSLWLTDRTAFSIKEIAPALASIFVQGVAAS